MRIRFSLRSLLAVPVVFAFVWLWATWPDRTFESFKQSLKDGQFELATSIVDCGECPLADGKKISFTVDSWGIRMQCGGSARHTTKVPYFLDTIDRQDRGISDFLQAKSVYRLRSFGGRWAGSSRSFEFLVERGQITLRCCGCVPPPQRSSRRSSFLAPGRNPVGN
jgi:hypothetical protein